MNICTGNFVELSGTLFKQHNHIDLFNILVSEVSSLYALHPGILAHDQIRGIAGNPFRREGIPLLLDLNVNQGTVLQFPQQIHDQKRAAVNHAVLTGQDTDHADCHAQYAGHQSGQPVRMDIGMEDPFEKRIIGKGQGLLSPAEIHEMLPPSRVQALVAAVKKGILPQIPEHLLFCLRECLQGTFLKGQILIRLHLQSRDCLGNGYMRVLCHRLIPPETKIISGINSEHAAGIHRNL